MFGRRQTKTHGRLMREELIESMEHFRMAAAHAAGGAAGAIAPRFEAARGRVEPTVNRSLDWLTETARDSARKANKTARKARNEKRGKSMAQRRWPMMVGGLLIAGAAAGAAGALISRRRQKRWNEYGTSTYAGDRSFASTAKSGIDAGMEKASHIADTARDKAGDVLGQVRSTTGSTAAGTSAGTDIGAAANRGNEFGGDTFSKTGATGTTTSKNSRP